jgi:hypothetical protein
MSLPKNRADREYQKFTEDAQGNTAVRIAPGAVTDTDGDELEINQFGQGYVSDATTQRLLTETNNLLEKILFQLECITSR